MTDKYYRDKKTKNIVYKNNLGIFITYMTTSNFPLSQLENIADHDLLFEILRDQQVNFAAMTKIQQSIYLDRLGLEN